VRWHRWIDTALDSPADIVPLESAVLHSARTYRAEARSVIVLFAGGAVWPGEAS
jgi:isoamylase